MRLWKKNVLIIIILILLVLCAVSISKASGEGSFTIIGGSTFATSKATIQHIYDGAVATNYGGAGAGLISLGKYGASSNLYYVIATFSTLTDTLRIVGSTKQIDSAKLMLSVHATPTAGDSVFASVYEIIRTYVVGDGGCGVCWDSAYAYGDGGCSGTPAAWGTAGCQNTTTDRKATRETVAGHPDSVLMTAGVADNEDSVYFYISGATIADTVNFKGLLIMPVAYGGNDGVQSLIVFHNLATAYPLLTVWYSDKAAPPAATTIPNYIHCPSGPGLRQSISGGSQIAHP